MVRQSYQPQHWVLQDIQFHLTIEQKPSSSSDGISDSDPPSAASTPSAKARPATFPAGTPNIDPPPTGTASPIAAAAAAAASAADDDDGESAAPSGGTESKWDPAAGEKDPEDPDALPALKRRDAVAPERNPPELHLHLRVSPIVLSLACTEGVFIAALLTELLPIFFPPDELPAATRRAASFPRLDRGDSDAESQAPEKPDLVMNLALECEAGPQLRLLDDSQGTLLPLYEMALKRLDARARLVLREPAPGSKADPLQNASATLALQLGATHFNVNNGYWEPVIEPWNVTVEWSLKTNEENASKVQAVQVRSAEPLEIDITHALLRSLISTARLMIRAVHEGADVGLARSPSVGDDRHLRVDGRVEREFESLAVCNLTDAPLKFRTEGEPTFKLVDPGKTLPFASSHGESAPRPPRSTVQSLRTACTYPAH